LAVKNFLYNRLVQKQEDYLKVLNDKGKVFDCQNKLLDASTKVVLVKQRIRLSAYYGDLYTLNKGMAESLVLEKYINFWGDVCKLSDSDYVKEPLTEIANLKLKYKDNNPKEMKAKICRILNQKKIPEINYAIDLCTQFQDSDSYRYTLSVALKTIQARGQR
jgi:hypothetical protein